MRRYTFLRHTADAKFRAYGKTLEEAFHNAALAVSSLMWDWQKVEKRVEHPVEIEGSDLKQLLSSFLEEIIYLSETKMFLLGAVEKMRIEKKENGYLLRALFLGDNFSDKYKIYGDVKAITYNEMEIHDKGRCLVQVVVDI